MSREIKCCDFATQSKMKHRVLPIISNIFYIWYLQELKSRYSVVHYSWLTRWENARSLTGIVATSTICEKTTINELELYHISFMWY